MLLQCILLKIFVLRLQLLLVRKGPRKGWILMDQTEKTIGEVDVEVTGLQHLLQRPPLITDQLVLGL
jgi:hypothetical protein